MKRVTAPSDLPRKHSGTKKAEVIKVTPGKMTPDNSTNEGQQGSGEIRERGTSRSSAQESGMQLPTRKEMIEALVATGLAVMMAVGANFLTRFAIHNLEEVHPTFS